MNKLANMRHWSERMSPNFGMSRAPNLGMHAINPHQKMSPQVAASLGGPQALDTPIHYSFNVPFASDLAGPNTEDILHATNDAVIRWTHAEDAPDDVPVHELPVHAHNLAELRRKCQDITQSPLGIEAHVLSTTPKHSRGQVTTVCLSGAPDLVQKSRESLLNSTPLSLVGCPLTTLNFPSPCSLINPLSDAQPSMSKATWFATLPRVCSIRVLRTSWTISRSFAASTFSCSGLNLPL